MYIVLDSGEIEHLASHVDCPEGLPDSAIFATLVGAMRHPGAITEPRLVYYETGQPQRRYVAADIGQVRIVFTYTADGLEFQPTLSDVHLDGLPPSVALEAARFARRECPVTFRPMFEFAGGEVQGNALRFATNAEAYGNAQDKFMEWTMPENFHVEKSLDPVNYTWSQNEGTKAL
jgi:hypothetical protein